jgi:hypothetical protein
MPLTPPKGWATLQEKARRATDPTELASIINEMNKLLAACEETAGNDSRKSQPWKTKGSGRPRDSKRTRR